MLIHDKFRRYLFVSLVLSFIVVTVAACVPSAAQPVETLMVTDGGLSESTMVVSPTVGTEVIQDSSSPSPRATSTLTPTLTLAPEPESVRFAVIGDYGTGEQDEAKVAARVKSWYTDFIITTGDNNYPDGELETIDEHIGQFYHEYIYPYNGDYGPGADINRFFPSLGNHDWNTIDPETKEPSPYLDYFTLPSSNSGNERYYDFTWGPVHFFALDSDSREPDGVGMSSAQATWLQSRLGTSTLTWKIVYFHHAPYSSGQHGPTNWMQWPFQEWGATTVLSGHDHTYERLLVDGIPYFVNGLGGARRYNFLIIRPESQVRYNADHGAMLVEVTWQTISFQFINVQGDVIDTYTIEAQPASSYLPLVTKTFQLTISNVR